MFKCLNECLFRYRIINDFVLPLYHINNCKKTFKFMTDFGRKSTKRQSQYLLLLN